MTSAAVTQLGEMISNINSSTNNSETSNGGFAGIFQTAADKSAEPEIQETETVKTSATEKTMGGSKTADKLRETKTNDVKAEPEDMEAVEEELEAAAEVLKTEVAEKLDMTVEELEKVMETLGLTDAALFTQEGMTALVMEAEQITTPVELLTNADVYQMLQELNETAENLLAQVQTENGLTDVQIQDVLTSFAEKNETPEMKDLFKNEFATDYHENGLQTGQQMQEATDVRETQEATEEISETKQENAENHVQKNTEEVTEVKENTTVTEHHSDAKQSHSEGNAGQNHMMNAEGNLQPGNMQTVNQTNAEYVQNLFEENVSAQEIYDQIGEYVKTHVRPGISEVEMQLNPESLGSLHIHLSSKQGNVTAQFVVQNEAVKTALEMQMIQLKENFAEQGIKVDAVEVTVESHSFNNEMQQNNHGEAEAQTETKRTGIRSINLNEDLAEEELTEEEQLVAEMMEADGNTVNYMA